MIPSEIAEFAEGLSAFTPDEAGFAHFVRDGYVVGISAGGPWTQVNRIRLDAHRVGAAVEDVRTLMREQAKTVGSWWVSDWTTPADIEKRLLALGLRIVPDDYDLGALALLEEPPPGPPEIDVQRVASADDYVSAVRASWEAFATPAEHRSPVATLASLFEAKRAAGVMGAYIARLDDEIVGTAFAEFSARGALLAGGSTLPEYRGRGAYRALVRARWDDAVERGTPALVVSAGAMAEPILKRLGFVEVCRFRRLEDALEPA